MIIDKYKDALTNMPASGGGGAHVAMLGIANLGVMASLSDAEIMDDIRGALSGTRKVPANEIQAAVDRARRECVAENGEVVKWKPPDRSSPVKSTFDKDSEINRLSKEADDKFGLSEKEKLWAPNNDNHNDCYSLAELWELSPVRLSDEIKDDPLLLFEMLYNPDDVLFLGSQYDTKVKTVAEWLEYDKLMDMPFIIPNPLTGKQHKSSTGKMSYRCDQAVKEFKYAVVEFDEMDIEQQTAFWLATDLEVCAIIHSGNKSLHGWVKADVSSMEEWIDKVKGQLFNYLDRVGGDMACSNPSRLSRLPGHFRTEKKKSQQLLFLSPDGTPPSEL